MNAPHTLLGKVIGSNISAIIPDYLKEKLYVDADVLGEGRDVHDYFTATPLKDSVAETLDELQVGGKLVGAYTWISRWKKRASLMPAVK